MLYRGVRGATTAPANTRADILEATEELLRSLVGANEIEPDALASAIFTATPDLSAAFPAEAARRLGWTSVPLLDAVEMSVPGAPERCIRVLLHWQSDRLPGEIRHSYLRGAAGLRRDSARGEAAFPRVSGGAGPALTTVPALDSGRRVDAEPTAVASVPGDSDDLTVAFQGQPGAYSQEAVFQHFGREVATLPCHDFQEIFAAVEKRKVHLGLLPVENSYAGSVHLAYDLLLEHDLRIVGEVKLRVRHCLLAPPGLGIPGIRRVRSHPQALAQCERYLRRRGWEAIPAYDTAGAAEDLALRPDVATAAIAGALAGQIYGLEVLEAGIEDDDDNTTRFFLLGPEDASPGPSTGSADAHGDKTSLVFATTHAPGALHRALGELAQRGINLTKIESRPRRNRPWQYVFYVDLEGHWQDPDLRQALVGLLSSSAFVKLLGSYRAASDP